jgi:peptidoglycan-associated lipoprotein
MRLRIKTTFALLLTMAAVSTAPVSAQSAAAVIKPLRNELALDYSYLRSNAPPGGCGCFNLNGGSATYAWFVRPEGGYALVADVSVVHAGAITASGYTLTLSTYTLGERYKLRLGHSAFQPFGQALVGVAHSSGTLVQGATPATAAAGTTLAASLGGGLDLNAGRRYFIRLFEADYLSNTFNNGVNNIQNNLRISAGLALHF